MGAVDSKNEAVYEYTNGLKLDLVAPGKLIQSTGGFGGTVIASGTSFATAHVTALASLIWEKDKSVSSQFVIELMKESANLYGEKEKYGAGLIDVSRALETYDEFKGKYKEKVSEHDTILGEKQSELNQFDQLDYVNGSWAECI